MGWELLKVNLWDLCFHFVKLPNTLLHSFARSPEGYSVWENLDRYHPFYMPQKMEEHRGVAGCVLHKTHKKNPFQIAIMQRNVFKKCAVVWKHTTTNSPKTTLNRFHAIIVQIWEIPQVLTFCLTPVDLWETWGGENAYRVSQQALGNGNQRGQKLQAAEWRNRLGHWGSETGLRTATGQEVVCSVWAGGMLMVNKQC